MFPQDSVTHVVEPAVQVTTVTDSVVRPAKPRTPYQVLRMLPRDATPAQQDSAIQATFQPAEIRYSNQPDTLHLPGHEIGVKVTDANIPIYYEKTFFAKSLQKQGKIQTMYGIPGDPIPYTLHNDHVMASVLLGMFMVTLLLVSHTRWFFQYQLKTFFNHPRTDDVFMPETSGEMRCQLFLAAQAALLLAILQFFFTQKYIGTTFILHSDYMLVGIFFLMVAGYFLVRSLLYTLVNSVFFSTAKNLHWQKTQLLIISVESLLVFPIVLLQVYFNLSTQNVILYLAIVLVLIKILTFYKQYIIFFRRFGGFLQIILYFCALEIVPMVAILGAMVLMGNILKINY